MDWRIRRGESSLVVCLWVVMFCAVPVYSGGLYLSEYGTQETGLAGAGSAARAQDASTLFTNPAGMVRLQQPELLMGFQTLYGHAKFHPDAATQAVNGSGGGGNAVGWFPGGSVFYVDDLTEDVKFGIGTFSYYGLGVDYENDWAGRYYVQEGFLAGLTIMPSIAFRVTDSVSLGAGLNAMYGIFEQKVAINNPLQSSDGRLKIKDEDWGFGANLGLLYELDENTRFGIQYLSEVEHNFEDRLSFSGLSPAFETILGSRGLLNARTKLTFDAPQSIMVSGFHQLTDKFALLGNVGWQDWSQFGKVGISIDSASSTSVETDRNYQDTWHTAIGCQYQLDEKWLLVTGFAYDSSIYDSTSDVTPDVPAREFYRFGVGAEYAYTKNMTIGANYGLAWEGNISMDQNRGNLSGPLSGKYEKVSLHFLNVTMKYRF